MREAFTLHRDALAPENLGLQLAEAKDLLTAVQDTMVTHQVATALAAQVGCPCCGRPRRHKDSRPIVMRTLFGTLRLDSPRWWHCSCTPRPTRTFSPLAATLPERTTPELSYLQAKCPTVCPALPNTEAVHAADKAPVAETVRPNYPQAMAGNPSQLESAIAVVRGQYDRAPTNPRGPTRLFYSCFD